MSVPEIIDLKQCAALLRCTVGEVEDMACSGEIPALHIAAVWLFVRSDLLVFLAQKARSDAQERRSSLRAKPRAPSPSSAPATPLLAVSKNNEQVLKLVSASEAAQLMSMGKSTFWRRVSEKKLPQPMKIGGLTRWRVADLVRFVEKMDCKDA